MWWSKRGALVFFRGAPWYGVLICLLAGVSACGFHLRGYGQQRVSIQGLYVERQSTSQFAGELSNTLEEAGSKLVKRRQDAKYILSTRDEQTGKNVLSVSPQGQVLEYELHYAVTFELMDRTGRRLIPPQRVSVVRDFTFNTSTALAKANEEQRLYGHLRREAIGQIIRRMQSTLSQ